MHKMIDRFGQVIKYKLIQRLYDSNVYTQNRQMEHEPSENLKLH